MKRSINRRRVIRTAALGLAVCAVAAPTGQAVLDPIHQSRAAGLGEMVAYGELHQFAGAGLASSRPDDRATRPGVGDGIAAMPTLDEIRQFSFDGPRGMTAAEWEADGFARITPAGGSLPEHSTDGPRIGPVTNLPSFATDGPRTAPDVVAEPSAPVLVARPGFDWSDAGIGIAIGLGAASLLGAALLQGMRRRGTLAGA